MAAISLFWDTNMAAVTSCENTLYVARAMKEQCQTVFRAIVYLSLFSSDQCKKKIIITSGFFVISGIIKVEVNVCRHGFQFGR